MTSNKQARRKLSKHDRETLIGGHNLPPYLCTCQNVFGTDLHTPIRSGASVEYMNCNLLSFKTFSEVRWKEMLVFNGKEQLKIFTERPKCIEHFCGIWKSR